MSDDGSIALDAQDAAACDAMEARGYHWCDTGDHWTNATVRECEGAWCGGVPACTSHGSNGLESGWFCDRCAHDGDPMWLA